MKMEAIIAPFPVMVVHGTGSQNLTAKEAFWFYNELYG